MKAKGLLLKSYSKDGGIFPKMFFDEVTKNLTVIEKDGTTYEIQAKKTKTGVFEYTFSGFSGNIVIPHGLGSDPSDVVTIYADADNGTTYGLICTVTHDDTNITIAFTNGLPSIKITVTWKVYA